MFTETISSNIESDRVQRHHGVDLTQLQCQKLRNDPVYSKYSKEQLHYVIDALQKGRKPPTQIGLTRLIKKNRARAHKKKLNPSAVPELNPKAPEEVCSKALRTEFRNELEKTHMQAEQERKVRSATIIKRKEHQKERRHELVRLIKKYKKQLQPQFKERLGLDYRSWPKVSRQELKDYLLTLGIEAKLDPVEAKDSINDRQQRRRGRGRQLYRPLRQLRIPLSNFQGIGQLPPQIHQMGLLNPRNGPNLPIPFIGMGMRPPALNHLGMPMPVGVPIGMPMPTGPYFGGPVGMPFVPPVGQPVLNQVPTAPVLNDEDFPTLLK